MFQNPNQFQQPKFDLRNFNPAQHLQEFVCFAKDFQGNPESMVRQLLQTGRMSQPVYNVIQSIAYDFMKILPRQ